MIFLCNSTIHIKNLQMESFGKLKRKAAYISLSIGLLMFIMKMGAYFITGSAAILSDALESVVHIFATMMALYSIILSSKPADTSHLYGHGNVEYFSAGIEGFLILLAALAIIYTAVRDLIIGVELHQLDVGVSIVGFAGLVNLFLGLYLIRIGKKTNSLTLVADGKHVLTDSVTSIGVVIGVALVMITGILIIDPLVAIFVAVNIIFTGIKLIRISIGGLMNETDKEKLVEICNVLKKNKKDHWIDLHKLRFWSSGEKVFIDFHLILPYYLTIEESHQDLESIEFEFQKVFQNSQVFIHFDNCTYDLCKFCSHSKCEVRKEERSSTVEWSNEKFLGKSIFTYQ